MNVDSLNVNLKYNRLMDQFLYVFETPYENTDFEFFNCNVDRIAQEADPQNLMYVINHFIYDVIEIGALKIEIPSKEKALRTNTRELLNSHISNCSLVFQKTANFIEVDFYTMGDALSVVSELNGVPQIPLAFKMPISLVDNRSIVIRKSNLFPTEHVLIDNISSNGKKLVFLSLWLPIINITACFFVLINF